MKIIINIFWVLEIRKQHNQDEAEIGEKSKTCQSTGNSKQLVGNIKKKLSSREFNSNRCNKCGKNFAEKSNLSKHTRICSLSKDLKRSMMRYSCDQCEYKCHEKSTMKRHQAKHSSNNFNSNTCSICGKNFSHRSTFLHHSKICGKPKDSKRSLMRFSCNECEYKCFFKEGIRLHIQARHLVRDCESNKCSKCNKSYANRANLWRHLKICGLSKNLIGSLMVSCDYCPYKTVVKGNLIRHIKQKHLPRDYESNKCSKCNKSYSCKATLLSHSRVCGLSQDLKRSLMLSCDYCEYKTLEKCNLAKHIKFIHLIQYKSNHCDKCGKSFSFRTTLLKHSKICGLSKDLKRSMMRFSCDQCKFKSHEKTSLIGHIESKHLPRDHTLFKCSKCKKIFSHRSSLNKHSKICGKPENIRDSMKLFSCNECKYKFYMKSNLVRHMMTQHLQRD